MAILQALRDVKGIHDQLVKGYHFLVWESECLDIVCRAGVKNVLHRIFGVWKECKRNGRETEKVEIKVSISGCITK